jgi:hypothetical protein
MGAISCREMQAKDYASTGFGFCTLNYIMSTDIPLRITNIYFSDRLGILGRFEVR